MYTRKLVQLQLLTMLETLYVGLSTVILGIEVMKMLKSAIIRKTPDKNEWCLFSTENEKCRLQGLWDLGT